MREETTFTLPHYPPGTRADAVRGNVKTPVKGHTPVNGRREGDGREEKGREGEGGEEISNTAFPQVSV